MFHTLPRHILAALQNNPYFSSGGADSAQPWAVIFPCPLPPSHPLMLHDISVGRPPLATLAGRASSAATSRGERSEGTTN